MNTLLPAMRKLRRDDRGSMPLLLMVIVVTLSLGALLLPIIINQTQSTRFDSTRLRALDAAQAGIDVTIGYIRATATNGSDYGNDSLLPCGPLTGTVAGVTSATYSVKIDYYLLDPTANPGARKMLCAPGAGPYDAGPPATRTPRYALISSSGIDGTTGNGASKGRTLVTTYAFKTDDVNVPGGQLRIYPPNPDTSGKKWCMDAGSAPAAGTQIVLRECTTTNPPAPQQVFAYRTDLSIQLVSSVTASVPTGLCLDTNPLTHAAYDQIVLKACSALGSAPWNQKWSVDDSAHLRGSNTASSDTDGYCIDVASQVTGQALTLQTCAGGVTDTRQTWIPSPSAGAGTAGATNSQLVNFQQFATCLDVTNQNPNGTSNSGAQFIILYTCKQNPDPTKVAWNQKFAASPSLGTGPTVVQWRTRYTDGTYYCLTSPLNTTGYVTVTPCSQNNAGTQWLTSQTKQANGSDLPYAQKFTMSDQRGFCLALGPNSDLYNNAYYKAVVAGCDGSTAQKWNADASLSTATQQNTHEEK